MTKKRNPTKAQRELAAQWESLLVANAAPLERGAKAKAAKPAITAAPSKMPQLVIPTERNSRTIASLDSGKGSTALPQPKNYTGDSLVGLAQMHKSNLVPVFNTDAVKDVAKMRR